MLRELFNEKAQANDLPVKADYDVSNISLEDFSNPQILKQLSSDKLHIITTANIRGMYTSAGLDPATFPRAMSATEQQALREAFEAKMPEAAMQLREKNIEPEKYNEAIINLIGKGPDRGPSNAQLSDDSAMLILTGLDVSPEEFLRKFSGVSADEFSGLPPEIAGIENLQLQIQAFAILHELEHTNAQRLWVQGMEMNGELDADIGALVALEDKIDPALMDYIVSARIVSVFNNGLFSDSPITRFEQGDTHGHSMGFMMKRMLDTGDTPSDEDMNNYSIDLRDITTKMRDQFGLLPEGYDPQRQLLIDVGVFPAVGQIMAAFDALLEKHAAGEVELTQEQLDMATQYLEAADSVGYKREPMESYTQEYQQAFKERLMYGRVLGLERDYSQALSREQLVASLPASDDGASEYWHNETLNVIRTAMREGAADKVREELPEELREGWDEGVREIQEGLSREAQVDPEVISPL